MKDIILNLVSTNSGWLARQIIKWAAAASLAVAVWLQAKGFSADVSMTVAAFVTTLFFGLVEMGLSFVARKYKVADGVKMDIEKLRKTMVLLLSGLCLLIVPSCATDRNGVVRFAGLTKAQFEQVLKDSGAAAAKAGLQAGMMSYGAQRLVTAAKEPVNVTP